MVEGNERRKARVFIHELADQALPALDRPYYRPESAEYQALQPSGIGLTRLPLVGPIIREVLRGDTLYHPEAYVHFAVAVSGTPGALQLYLGSGADDGPAPAGDSWSRS